MCARRGITAVLFLVTAAFQGGCQNPGQGDGVFVHIKQGAEAPHAVLMGLKMANLMAEDREVLVYFDLAAVEHVLKDSPVVEHVGFEPAHTQLQSLVDSGVPLYACPTCLTVAGKTEQDLREGVHLANKEAFFGFTKGRVLTLDY